MPPSRTTHVPAGFFPEFGAPLDDLGRDESAALLATSVVARIAFTVPGHDGGVEARIVPVNYTARTDDEGRLSAVEFRTRPDSELSVHAPGQMIAFEVDQVDPVDRGGWSVVIKGRCERVLDRFAETALEASHRAGTEVADPWAEGRRSMVLRLDARTVTGKVVGLRRL